MNTYRKALFGFLPLFVLFGTAYAANITVDGSDAGCDNIAGSPYCDIQPAVDAATAGDTIEVADGTYAETVDISTPDLTINGESEAGTIIDASPFSDYGIHITADNVTLSSLTLNGPDVAAYGYGIKAANHEWLTLANVTVKESGRSEIDLNGVDNALLSYVTAIDGGAGVGIALTDSNNVTVDHPTTADNTRGGIAIYTYGVYYPPAGSNGVMITNHTFNETVGLYSQTHDGTVTNLYNPQYLCSVTTSALPDYTWYFTNESDAKNFEDDLIETGIDAEQISTTCDDARQFTATQGNQYNRIGTDHTVQADIDMAVAGVPVVFERNGVNTTTTLIDTDANGQADYTYSSDEAGVDTITTCVDQNDNETCDEREPQETFTKYWYRTWVHGGGHLLDETGKRKDRLDISYGGGIYDLGADGYQGDWQINLHNVGDKKLKKSKFHTNNIVDLNWYPPTSDSCIGAINFTAYGEFDHQPNHTLVVRASDSGEPASNNTDTVRITIYDDEDNLVYDSVSDFPADSDCVGTNRTSQDAGNITIDHGA